jgi:signal transduction histidine kinase
MKLITKASRTFLITCSIALVIGTFLGIFIFKRIMSHEATEHLLNQRLKVENYVSQNEQLPANQFTLSDSLWFTSGNLIKGYNLKDTLFYNYVEAEPLMYRQISFGVKLNGEAHTAFILHPMYETEDLTEAIVSTLFGIVLLILVALFVTNYLISKRLWQPFYRTLENLSGFKITQKDPLVFDGTEISEFNQLQEQLSNLTNKVRSDYQSLKSFTENASHELQTPLSVIGSNLEMLIQDENMTENQLKKISQLIDSLGKVSKLNQTLLLLTKIENRQFVTAGETDLSEVIENKLALLNVWINHKSIDVETEIIPNVNININPYLLEILLNNILGNAIKYNAQNGKLRVQLSDDKLVIQNSGAKPDYSTEEMFGRFRKGHSNADSLGLGLAIVKQICDTYQFEVSYSYTNDFHALNIRFQ